MAEHQTKSPAGDTEKTKKVKNLLIKHSPSDSENNPAKNSSEQGERPKARVVIKTKSAAPKKTPPKVVISSPSGKPNQTKKSDHFEDKKSGYDNSSDSSRVSSFPASVRPAAAAGRVGGKLVGNHGQQRPPRPGGQQQQRGGRPGADQHHNRGQGFTPRQGQGQQGAHGSRPPFPPRPGQGGKPGFGGGFNRPQPGGNRTGAAPTG